MTKKRKRRRPEQIVKALQEGGAMLAAGKGEAEVFQALEISSATCEKSEAAEVELEKMWADKKNIYPHRLRGLMLAFGEVDPTSCTQQLKPLVDHRDESTKQDAA